MFTTEDAEFRDFMENNTEFSVIVRNADGSAVVASGSDIPAIEETQPNGIIDTAIQAAINP